MLNIHQCLIKHPYSDRKGLLEESQAYEDRGLSPEEASQRAIADRIEDVQAQMGKVAQSVIEAYAKAQPEKFARLKPMADEAQTESTLDLKGFDIRKAADGFLTLRDGDLLVEATPTAEGRYQASIPGSSVRSSPHLQGEQGAVDWAANYRDEKNKAPAQLQFDPTSPDGYAKVMSDPALQREHQDRLDAFFQERLIAVRNALRAVGWEGERYGSLTKGGSRAIFTFTQIGAGRNVVGMAVNGTPDDLTKTAEEFAADVSNSTGVAAEPSDNAAELLAKLATGYGYAGGIDTMPDGLGKTARKLQAAILARDLSSALNILQPNNQRSREAFESLFNGKVKLPKTIKGTRAVVEDFLGKIEAGLADATETTATDDLGALFDEVMAEETAPKAKRERKAAEPQAEPSDAVKRAAAGLVIVPGGSDGTPHIVRDPRDNGGSGVTLASFEIGENGRPVKVRHYYDHTQDYANLAIKQWAAANQPAPVQKPRTATQSAASAAKNTAAGLSDTISALGALFKPKPGTLRSGVGWDEDTYRAAQPLFKQAIAHFKDAGQDLKEAMRAIVRMVLDQFGADTAANMKPYVVRFMEDVRDGKINYDETVTQDQEEAHEPTGNDRGDESALAPVSPAGVQDASGGASPGEGSNGSGGSDAGGNGRAGEDVQDHVAGSLGGSSGTVLSEEPDTVNIGGETKPLEEVAESVKNDPPASEPKPKFPARFGDNPGNFRIIEPIGTGTTGERIRANMAAVRLVLDLERENRYPTRDEQAVLAKYVGWGGLKNVFKGDNSTSKQERDAHAELKRILTPEQLFWMGQSVLDAHYTSSKVIGAMYRVLDHFGITGGRFLEPTVGVGNFIGLMPEGMASGAKWFASEIDPITSLIAKNLYPDAQILPATGFQEAEFAYGRMDVAIGNPPFGDQRITDTNKKRADISGFKIHNYILAKSAMHLRPGGIMSFVVTSRFLDTANPEAREYLSKNFRFLGAFRLPNNAFAENAGTEVTTDLIFLQRMREGQREGSDNWLDTNGRMLNEDGETVTLNRYFAENPGQMLGKPSMHGTMYGGNKEKGEFTLEPIPGMDIDQEIERILGEDWDGYEGIGRPRQADRDEMAAGMEFNREDVPIGGYYMDNGRVVQRVDDDADGNTQFRQLTPETPWTEKQTLGATRLERITGMLELRGMAYDLMAAERGDMGTDFIEGKRQLLNEKYDAFVKKHGFLNDRANRALMDDDPRIEFGLESGYTKAISAADAKRLGQAQAPAKAAKTSILKERVFFPKQEVLSADTPQDGYSVSLSEKGKLDLEYISELTGQSVEKVIQALSSGDSPLIYRDPVLMRWVQEDEYLSGNVKDKLKAARGAGLTQNIKALEAVQPPDVAPHDIHAEFGATWIRPSIYEDFLKLLGYDSAQVAVLPKSGTVDAVSVGRGTASPFRADLENPDYTLDQVFSHVANRRQMVAYDGRGDTRTMNAERTEQLGRIRNKLIAIWTDWIKSDPERSALLARDYNELMNTTIERRYDGVKHLVTVGANPAISLRNSQKNAAWRMIQSSTILMDHVVGAGKTIALTTGLMERKRLGLSKKPMVVVPNHLVGQWARDWLSLYPGANILAATEKDFSSKNRRRLFARIATGKYDAVIVGHSSFGFIPVSKEAEVQFIMSEVKHLEDALSEAEAVGRKTKDGKESRQVRAIKNRIAKRMEKIKTLQDKPRDNVVTFEEMGIDYLAVDELHEFKNLEYATTLSNVAGMGSPEGSKKAFDMFMKMRLLQEWGGGIAGATGTPLSNSMVEMYSLLRYMNPGALASRGMEQFDAWVKAFASIEPRDEYTAAGKVKQRTVLAAFNNLPELLQMYKQFADTITMTDLKRITAEQIREENRLNGTRKREEFPVPKVAGGGRRLDIGAPTAEQQEFMDYLIARADILDQKKGKDKQAYARFDNALWLMSDARKMSLDVRIIDPTAPDNPSNKVNRAAAQIKAIYDRTDADLGTQLVFCDLSTPSKVADKDAKSFIKKTLESLGLDKDAAAKDALVGKTYRDQWDYLALRADAMLESGDLKDAKRESIEAFMESVGDDEISALQTADVGFSVYDDLKAKLIGLGIPEREIAFIHDATTSDKKKELFDLVNAGNVRVLLGSSVKMGAGTNVQRRAVALHHMDAPWRPSDIEQREGRVIRQGNMFYERDPDRFAVDIIAYSTERTFDAQMWGVLARKAAFLEQFRKGLRSIKEDGSDADSYAEFMATATGDEIFRTKLQTERELDDLEAEDRSAKMKRAASEQIVSTAEGKRTDLESKLSRAHKLAGADLSTATFEGKTYRNDIMQVFEEEVSAYREKKAAYDKEDDAYKVARKAWEDSAGTERGKPPAKPKAPEVPELNSDGVIARSEWAQLVDVLTKRMEMVGKDQQRTFDLQSANGTSIPFAVQRSNWDDNNIVLILDGRELVTSKARGAAMAANLTPNKILGELRSRPIGIEANLRSLAANVQQAKITLEHVKPVDPAAIAEVKARYEEVKKAVDDASAKLAAERAQRSNRFIARDRVRFSQAHASEELSKQAIHPVPAEANPSSVFRKSDANPSSGDRVKRADAESFLRAFLATYPNAPSITLVDSFSALPEDVRRDALNMGFTQYSTLGAISKSDGALYVVVGNHSSMAGLQATLFHEVLGHAGIRKELGNDFMRKLNQIFIGLGGVEGLARIMEKRGMGKEFRDYWRGIGQSMEQGQDSWDDAKAHWMITEEVFAHIAERPQLMDRFMALIGQIRAWLRQHTFLELANLGTTDMLFMLQRARENLGGGPGGGGNTVLRNGVAVGPKGIVDSAGRLIAREGSPEFDALKVLADKLGLSEQPMATVFSAGTESEKADTINVDGVERPRLNSNGKPIHPTEEGIRNFWRWFGDSKVVDEQGRPLVVYHGTTADFDAFRDTKNGAFFFEDKPLAELYGRPVPAYLSIQHAAIINARGAFWNEMDGVRDPIINELRKYVPKLLTVDHLKEAARQAGYDGAVIMNTVDNGGAGNQYVAFRPDQIKSATGNNGKFDADSPSTVFRSVTEGGRDAPRTLRTKIADLVGGLTGESAKTFNWWQRSVGSQYGKSKSDPQHFGRVYKKAHDFLDDVRRFATESADLAKNILPHLDDWKDITAGLNVRKQWADAKDYQAIAPAIFEGTLENGTTGKVWTDRELRDRFDLNDKQVELYREFRAAVDRSLETLASSEMARAARAAKLEVADPGMSMDEAADYYAGQVQPAVEAAQDYIDGLKLRHQMELEAVGLDGLDETYDLKAMAAARRHMELRQAAEMADAQGELDAAQALQESFEDKSKRIRQLQSEGYAPLMRFGQYTVDVVRKDADGNIVKNDDGDPDRPFFGMFETEAEATKAAKILGEEYPGHTVTRGILSTDASQLYKGLTPETAELFGRLLGTDENGAFQAYLKQAVANRSAMKRLIQRQGMEGFATDVPRVLSAFIASSARLASGNWHFGELSQAVQDIPKEKGDVKDEAIRLMQYIQNPQEEAQVLRGFLFFNFLGGSLASAAVNLTQSFTTTLPYLSQFGAAKVSKVLPSAMKLAGKMMTKGLDAVQDADLKAALHKASEDGTVDPQEIHLLMAESGGGGGVLGRAAGAIKKEWENPASRIGRAFTQAWGSMFGMAEKFNRHVAFIAAWEMAPEGVDRYAFAKQAVTETQFEYSKVNRPNWARGAIGATLFTFKTFTINYVEFLSRLPSRERAVALAVLMLLAGLSGAPGGDDLDDLIDTIGQKMGYNWNNSGARHAWLMKTIGQGGANFVEHGVSSFLPLDVSSRLGMGNLIPGTGILQKSNQSPSRDVGEFFGPAGSLAMGARDVFDSVGSGKGVGATLRPVLPKMINDAMQALDMAQTGQYRDYRGRKVVDVGLGDALVKSIGFQPNAVAEPRRVERMLAQSSAMQRAIKSDINELWARGQYEGDSEKVAAAKEMLRIWNEKNPETPIRANPASIAQRVRAMRSSSADRLVKATPKEMRGALAAELSEQ